MPTLRELFQGDGAIYGGWCHIPSAFSAELMGRAGFDWACVDMQHGIVGYDAMAVMLQALAITRIPAFVRVPWNQPDHIMKALDAGAQGIIVPMVSTAADAERAVSYVKYPPHGVRSWGPIRASLDSPKTYTAAWANGATVVAAMIETPEGVANMDEIMRVDGVDAIYVGPSDLALGHGLEPTLSGGGDEHEALIQAVLEGCQRNGVVPGIHTDGVETATRRRAAGFRMITILSDGGLMRTMASRSLAVLRGGEAVGGPTSAQYA